MRSMLFGIVPGDSLSFAGALLGVTLVALAASAIPARRAASVDPIDALRYELYSELRLNSLNLRTR